MSWLNKSDIVALEAGNQSFRLAKKIMKKVKCDVVILNPSYLAMIYQSLKKTDKEEALKLARLIKRIPREELPEVPLPSAKEEKARRLVSEHGYWTKQKVMSQNRLHSIFTREGFTEITRNHLNGKKKRTECLERLRSSDSFDYVRFSEPSQEMVKFYYNLATKRGKKRAIIALARKMIEVIYVMFSNNEPYRGMTGLKLDQKLLRGLDRTRF